MSTKHGTSLTRIIAWGWLSILGLIAISSISYIAITQWELTLEVLKLTGLGLTLMAGLGLTFWAFATVMETWE